MTVDSGSPRDVPLEALRGLAALAVIGWHFTMSFYPSEMDAAHCTLCTTPLFGFIHGTAAVGVFFALSGYVLTRRYFETGEKRILVVGALKRWFRLFLPVFLSVMVSWLLFHFNLYAYEKAADITRCGWLITFGFSMRPPFVPDFWMALKEGLTEAFFHNNNALNPILWTIHLELIGSFVVFAFAALAGNLRGQPGLVLLLAAIVEITLHFIDPALAPFVPGCLLALYAPRPQSISGLAAIGLIALGIAFLGYRMPVGFYFMFNFSGPMDSDTLIDYTSAVGALLIMIAFIGCAPLRQVLSGRISRLLGRLSFPLYLVHMILICSLASGVFVFIYNGDNYNTAVIIAALVTLPVVLALAGVFAVIDVKWIAFVNRMFRRVQV